jgi:PBP1b-binding outer membrane lipoprotein LpoB
MKKLLFLVGAVVLSGCVSNVQQPSLTVGPVSGNRTATVTPRDTMFSDIPLKPMTASQSAARMN